MARPAVAKPMPPESSDVDRAPEDPNAQPVAAPAAAGPLQPSERTEGPDGTDYLVYRFEPSPDTVADSQKVWRATEALGERIVGAPERPEPGVWRIQVAAKTGEAN